MGIASYETLGVVPNVSLNDSLGRDVKSDNYFTYPLSLMQQQKIIELKTYIEKNVLYPFADYELINACVWTGVDEESTSFHNDSKHGINSTFLLYFNDTSPKTGGKLCVKNVNSEEVTSIYPKKGTVAWLNQSNNFLHMAERSSETRTVVGLDYLIKGIQVC